MKKIGDTLNEYSKRGSYEEQLERMKNEILNDKAVRAFIEGHSHEITGSMIDKSLVKLYEYISQSRNCENCTCLAECQNIIPGYEPELVIERNAINVHYIPCRLKLMDEEKKKAGKLVQSLHMPKEILDAKMGNVILDSEIRVKAFKKVKQFVEEYDGTNFKRGLYLYGPFGTGKTFFLGAIANALASKHISSMLVYVPEFIREMKQSISENTLNDKIDAIKNVQVLMFDDIGAETVSSWVRDEVLGPILQYRMLEKLPTFFTSNFNLKDLEHHLTYSQRGEEEKVKAARIMERIQYLSEPIMLDGPNRRFSS